MSKPVELPTLHVRVLGGAAQLVLPDGPVERVEAETPRALQREVVARAVMAARLAGTPMLVEIVGDLGDLQLTARPDGTVAPGIDPGTPAPHARPGSPTLAPWPASPANPWAAQPVPTASTTPQQVAAVVPILPTPAPRIGWVLVLDTGERLAIPARTVILGRQSRQARNLHTPEGTVLLTIPDATGTISRQHARLSETSGGGRSPICTRRTGSRSSASTTPNTPSRPVRRLCSPAGFCSVMSAWSSPRSPLNGPNR